MDLRNAAFTPSRWRGCAFLAKLATRHADRATSMPRLFAPLLRWLVAAAAGLCATGAAAAPQTYRFDPVHSQIVFSVDHQKFSTALGRLRILDGWFHFDEDDWSQARLDVVVDLASVDLGDAKWNDAARSNALLDTARWPTARYTSRSVQRVDATHGVIHGDLAFRGKTEPVDVAFTLNRIATDPYLFKRKAGFSATATLTRQDFGMTRYADVVGAKVALRIEIEGVVDSDAAKTNERASNHDIEK